MEQNPANRLETVTTLVNDKVRFSGTARNNPAVIMDYFPPLGDGEGYSGLEMLLLSLSCCSGTAIRLLLQKMNKTVNGLTVHAAGIRQEKPPFAFSAISLDFKITTPDAGPADMDNVLLLAESTLCPVWSLIKGNVDITVTYDLLTS